MKSKKIKDFKSIDLDDLHEGPIPFSIHLYFSHSDHIIAWKSSGDQIESEFLEKYRSRGISKVWIHESDWGQFENYKRGKTDIHPLEGQKPLKRRSDAEELPESLDDGENLTSRETPKDLDIGMDEYEEEPYQPKTKEGAMMGEVMHSKDISDEEKEEILTESAQAMMTDLSSAETVEEQEEVNQKQKDIVEDLLSSSTAQAKNTVKEIWHVTRIDPTLEHSINVATYSVIFSMAFGNTDSKLISDLALAGLLHDIGLSQLPHETASEPFESLPKEKQKQYAGHIQDGIQLISEYAPSTPKRVKDLISQHHEKFDGSGYPRGLKGFDVNDAAQLIHMADMIDMICQGQWDGKKRTTREAFEVLEKLETKTNYPQHFNPDVLKKVLAWSRSDESVASTDEAIKIVTDKAKEITDLGKTEKGKKDTSDQEESSEDSAA